LILPNFKTILCSEPHTPAPNVTEPHQEFKTPVAHGVQEQDADREGSPRCLVSSEKKAENQDGSKSKSLPRHMPFAIHQ